MVSPSKHDRDRSWAEKFRDAFVGLGEGVRGQSSFRVHFLVAVAVIAAAAILRMSLVEWSLLMLCIAGVIAAELINSALESLAKAITDRVDPHIDRALKIGSAAVLIASIGAVVVGTIVFGNRLLELVGR